MKKTRKRYWSDRSSFPVPDGRYAAIICDRDVIIDDRKNKFYVLFEYRISEGPYSGRLICERLYMLHRNSCLVRAHGRRNSSLRRAVEADPGDADLIGRRLQIDVRNMPTTNGTGDLQIIRYRRYE